jgi:hypothetical protein
LKPDARFFNDPIEAHNWTVWQEAFFKIKNYRN